MLLKFYIFVIFLIFHFSISSVPVSTWEQKAWLLLLCAPYNSYLSGIKLEFFLYLLTWAEIIIGEPQFLLLWLEHHLTLLPSLFNSCQWAAGVCMQELWKSEGSQVFTYSPRQRTQDITLVLQSILVPISYSASVGLGREPSTAWGSGKMSA